jgi:dynein heavy chain
MGPDQVYEDIQDIGALKKTMNEVMDEYNNSPGIVAMDLVLFRDAIEHSECNCLALKLIY